MFAFAAQPERREAGERRSTGWIITKGLVTTAQAFERMGTCSRRGRTVTLAADRDTFGAGSEASGICKTNSPVSASQNGRHGEADWTRSAISTRVLARPCWGALAHRQVGVGTPLNDGNESRRQGMSPHKTRRPGVLVLSKLPVRPRTVRALVSIARYDAVHGPLRWPSRCRCPATMRWKPMMTHPQPYHPQWCGLVARCRGTGVRRAVAMPPVDGAAGLVAVGSAIAGARSN